MRLRQRPFKQPEQILDRLIKPAGNRRNTLFADSGGQRRYLMNPVGFR